MPSRRTWETLRWIGLMVAFDSSIVLALSALHHFRVLGR